MSSGIVCANRSIIQLNRWGLYDFLCIGGKGSSELINYRWYAEEVKFVLAYTQVPVKASIST